LDEQKAFKLYQKAAKLSNKLAQYNLALMYEDGSGVEKNIDQAIYWFKKSAEQGDQDAQIKLNEYLEG
jgi:TPR repeat protein